MLTFQKATSTDIKILQELAHTIWHSHYPGIISMGQIEFMLNLMYSTNTIHAELNEGYCWALLLLENKPAGFLSFHFEPDITRVKLDKLYVLSEHHGKGYGWQSLEYVKKCAAELKANYIYLSVNKNNKKAINSYLKSGFYIEKEVVTDIGNGFVMDDYIMAYKL